MKNALLFFLALLTGCMAWGQTSFTITYTGLTGNTAASGVPTGIINTTPYTGVDGSCSTTANGATTSYSTTITAATGYSFTITSVSGTAYASSAGSKDFSFRLTNGSNTYTSDVTRIGTSSSCGGNAALTALTLTGNQGTASSGNAVTITVLRAAGGASGGGYSKTKTLVIEGTVTANATAATVTTPTSTSITASSATLGGNVTSAGTASITERGVVYSLTSANSNPLISGTGVTKITATGTTGVFTAATTASLSVNSSYSFKAFATSSAGTGYTSVSSFYTLANVPGTPVVNGATVNSLDVTISANSNPSNTQFAIQEAGGQYVQANGSLAATAIWQTLSAWGTLGKKTVTGLTPSTNYTFSVKARNGASTPVETAFGASAQGATLAVNAPSLSAGTLAGFGNICVNSNSTAQSFILSGSNLDGSDITIGPLAGFSFSSSQNGGYNSSLSIAGYGTSVSQSVYVIFTPTAVQSYNGNIPVSGGNASSISVAATGSGINTLPTVTTGTSINNLTAATVTLAGSINVGCSSIDSYGIAYSSSSGFSTGTQVTGGGGSSFTAAISGLSPKTVYYYKAFVVSNATTYYGSQQSFTTSDLIAPVANNASGSTHNSFTANWTSVAGASSYQLDVSNTAFNQFASDLIISEYVEGSGSNKYIEIFNGTGNSVDLSNYRLRLYANGSTGTTSDVVLSGTIATGATVVYQNSSAALSLPSGVTATDNAAVNFNGNDAVALAKNGNNIDIIGTIGNSDNFGVDVTLRRNANVSEPSTSYNANDWTSYSQNTVSDLGSHSFNADNATYVTGYQNRSVNGTSQVVSGLSANTTYYYRVRAFHANSTSSNSNIKTASTTAAPASQPTDYFRTRASGSFSATSTWQSSSNGVDYINATIAPGENAAAIAIENGNVVTMNIPFAYNGELILNNGFINTSSSNLLTLSASATVSNASSSSFVNGPIAVSSTGAFNTVYFPVGKNGVFKQFYLYPETDDVVVFTGEYFASDAGNYPTPGNRGLQAIQTNEYWQLTNNAGTSVPVYIGFAYNAIAATWNYGTPILNHDEIVMVNYTGTEWQLPPSPTLAANASQGNIETTEPVDASGKFTFGYNRYEALIPTYTWTGSSNSSWNNAANWDQNNVPQGNENIVVPNTTNKPALDVDYTLGTGTTLLLENGTTLSVQPGKRLNILGTADFNNQSVTLKSSASADGTIGYGGTISGATAVTFERYLGARRSYRYLTTPVTTSGTFYANWMEGGSSAAGFGTKVTGITTNASGFDATSFNNNPSAWTWNGGTGWHYLTSTSGTLVAGEPYRLFVRGDRTINVNDPNATATATVLRSTGTLFTAASSSPSLESGASYYSFVGNPYASVLDFGNVGITKTNLTGFIYVWDAGIGGANGRGAYVTVNVAANTNNISGSGGSKYIQPGQAFFVRSSAASPALTIPTSALVTGNHVSIMDAQTPNLLRASLFAADELNSGIARDGFVLLFDAGFTKEASIVEDAQKMTNPDENLGILRGDKRFAIELLPEPTTGDEVPVFSSQYRGKAYSFVVDGSQWQTGSNLVAYLVDKFTGTETAVNAGEKQQYDFSVDAGVAASVASDRFVIRFAAGSTLPVQFTNLQAIPRNGSVSLVWSVASEQNRLKYEVERSADGRSFSSLKSVSARGTGSIAASYDLVDAQPVNGVNYYRVKAIDVNGNSSYSNVVKANLGKISKGIELYPNPVAGRQFQLGLNDMPAGKYSISLYSSNGQLIEVQSLQHNGGSVNQQVTLSKTLSTGYYQLRVQGNNGEQQVLQLIAK